MPAWPIQRYRGGSFCGFSWSNISMGRTGFYCTSRRIQLFMQTLRRGATKRRRNAAAIKIKVGANSVVACGIWWKRDENWKRITQGQKQKPTERNPHENKWVGKHPDGHWRMWHAFLLLYLFYPYFVFAEALYKKSRSRHVVLRWPRHLAGAELVPPTIEHWKFNI